MLPNINIFLSFPQRKNANKAKTSLKFFFEKCVNRTFKITQESFYSLSPWEYNGNNCLLLQLKLNKHTEGKIKAQTNIRPQN